MKDWKAAIDLLDTAEKKVAFAWTRLHELSESCPSRSLWDEAKKDLKRKP